MKRFAALIIIFLFSVSLNFCTSADRVTFVEQDNQIDIMVDGDLFTSYIFVDTLTKPILFPVYTPSGVKVTRSFPFEEVEGESSDHPHHTGIFFTYDEVNESGFWNNTKFPPQIVVQTIDNTKTGDVGVISSTAQWISKDREPLLEEQRTMTFMPGEKQTSVDFDITLTALADEVVFGDTKEGMFGIRVAHWLREKDYTGEYLSSEGDTGARNVWGKRAKWVTLEGNKEGQSAGIAILNHPESVNYPTFWHARDYGLFAANPLGQFVFQNARGEENPQKFELTLEKGEQANFKFRVTVYDGDRTAQEIEQIFDNYTSEN